MASTTKKSWKLQEFMGHNADVKCLGLGHKSGRVMVTGGDDRKVNLWSVGKPNCIMSLTGHTTPVESVRFGHDEEVVVAGSLSGALKIWNLEEAKILRTLTGHKSGIKALDFHPYGNYVASGSMDCTIKLWDVRRKGCIYTYKSHTDTINCLRFTPDGQWIASASKDGTVKIWDLTAGKLLTELSQHKDSVNIVEFHPSDLLLASGSSDRTVRFWDLETFQTISTSDTDKSPVRSIAFHPDGKCLYSTGGDNLKVYSWEPFVCHDIVPVNWAETADMAIANSQLIGASFHKMNISTHVVDLQKVAPIGAASKSESVRSALTSSSGRRSFITDRPPTSCSREACEPKRSTTPPEKGEGTEDDGSTSRADIQNQDDYRRFFKGDAKNPNLRNKEERFQPPLEDDSQEPIKVQKPSAPAPGAKKEVSPRPKPSSHKQAKDSILAEDFLPRVQKPSEMSDSELINGLLKGHDTMMTVLQQRSRNLQVVRAMWTSGNTKTAIDSAISMKDQAVMVDLMNIMNSKSSLWNLDLCNLLLPQLKNIMCSKYESHIVTASNSVKLILRSFGPVIKSNMEDPPHSYVDISRDERHKKCLACYTVLQSIKSMIQSTSANEKPKLASLFREIMLLMSVLE